MNNRKTPVAAGASGTDFADCVIPPNSADVLIRQRLDLFALRSREMVERVDAGLISFTDAVDLLYSASVWSGLSQDVGDDLVQQTLHRAFRRART